MQLPHQPMTLTRRAQPFSNPDWLFEIKHDGFRALAYLKRGQCQLVSRKGYVYKRFGELTEHIGATTPILENVRKRLRSLVKFIDKTRRQNIYTDFVDLMGEEREVELPGFHAGLDVERFRDKTHQFLKAHENDPVIHKLRWNESLRKEDLDALEKMLVEAGAGTVGEIRKIRSGGELGLFVRSLVGLDKQAAKRAFDGFLAGKTLTANQIQFVNLVIDYLTQGGWMSPGRLYESPFTDFSPKGVEGVFGSEQVLQLVGIINDIRKRAAV